MLVPLPGIEPGIITPIIQFQGGLSSMKLRYRSCPSFLLPVLYYGPSTYHEHNGLIVLVSAVPYVTDNLSSWALAAPHCCFTEYITPYFVTTCKA
jgi:hypothetical protein